MEKSYFTELVGKEKGVTELFNINPDRADLVGYPAIGRKFLLIKSHTDGKTEKNTTKSEGLTMNDILLSLTTKVRKSSFSSEAVDAFAKLEKSVTDGNSNEAAVTGLLKDLEEALKDDSGITKSQFDLWLEKATELLKDETPEVDDEEVEEEAEDEAEEEVEKDAEEEAEAEEAVDEPEAEEEADDEEDPDAEEADAEEEPADKEVQKSLEAQIKKQATELKEARKDLKKAQKGIEDLRIEKQRKDLIFKSAEELQFIGKSADDLGDLLMSLKMAGVPEDVFDTVFGLLKSNNDMIKQSGFFNEFGTSTEDEDDEVDSDTSLMKSAKKLVEDKEFETVEQAYVSLLRTDPTALQN